MQYKKQDGAFENDKIIASGNVKIQKEITDLGLRHGAQVEILQKIQDRLLNKQLGQTYKELTYDYYTPILSQVYNKS